VGKNLRKCAESMKKCDNSFCLVSGPFLGVGWGDEKVSLSTAEPFSKMGWKALKETFFKFRNISNGHTCSFRSSHLVSEMRTLADLL